MMDDKGAQLNEKEDKILIQIIQRADGQLELKSSLQPPLVVYLFEELKSRMFVPRESPVIRTSGHNIMNFVRGGMKK